MLNKILQLKIINFIYNLIVFIKYKIINYYFNYYIKILF